MLKKRNDSSDSEEVVQNTLKNVDRRSTHFMTFGNLGDLKKMPKKAQTQSRHDNFENHDNQIEIKDLIKLESHAKEFKKIQPKEKI